MGIWGTQPWCFLASWLLAPLQSVPENLWPCYFWKTLQVGKTIPLTVKKKEEIKSQTNPQGIFGFGVASQERSSVSFVSLHLGPIKYITYLFLALFSKGGKKIQQQQTTI